MSRQSKYRCESEDLFQPVPRDFEPSKFGAKGYDWRNHGCNAWYVDNTSGWAWDRTGTDWLDKNNVRYGAASFFTEKDSGLTNAIVEHEIDVTEFVQEVQQQNRWNAMLVRASKGSRTMAGAKHADYAPWMLVEYENGDQEILHAIYSAKITTSTRYCQSTSTIHTLPAVLEFQRPRKDVPVARARMRLVITSRDSTASNILGFLLDPPVNNKPVEFGVAANYGDFDAQLDTAPEILGVHRYVDGAARSDFISDSGLVVSSERNYSPHIWNRGPVDTSKLPFLDLGKFIAAGPNFELVDSRYQGDGFTPLAPGMGAMKVSMPKTPGAQDGMVIDNTGTTASIARIFLPDEHYGLLKRIFVRYYVMFAPFDSSVENRFAYRRQSPTGPVAFADMAGKTGITPSHVTRWGFSGSSGGGYGHQMRLSWAIRNAEMGPPSGGGISLGLHTFDYGINNPPGHQYGSSDEGKDKMFGSIGGLGGVIFPGHWYCIEMEENLNTVMQEEPGWIADGAVKVWVDGRAALQRSGMVMRSLPLQQADYVESSIRPARELGHAYLDFNWYHGGTTENPIDMTMYVSGLAWGTRYIGPMKLGSAT